MKRIISLLIALFTVNYALAALPPQYQNVNDLDVMVDYIKKHPEVASTLKSIELIEYTIYYGDGCKVVFNRKPSTKPGPAAPLEFRESNCVIK